MLAILENVLHLYIEGKIVLHVGMNLLAVYTPQNF